MAPMRVEAGRVLVVDDDAENRETLCDLLSSCDFVVTLAPDGHRALELVARHSFDVMLLDIMMPELDGFEVLARVRQRFGLSQLPVIMLTGRDDNDHVVRALEGGANDYVTKPFDLMVVVARLRTQISLKQAFDQIMVLEGNLEARNSELLATNKLLEKANTQMRSELRSAAAVQRALLPSALPDIPGVRFTWAFEPCDDLAGDILNVTQLDDEHVAFYLLDVSGHGVRAALLSVTLSRILAPLPDQPSLVRRPGPDGHLEATPPVEVAEELNRRFQLDLETYQYFTLFYGVLNTRTHTLRYINAGQPGPVYVPAVGPPRDLSKPVLAIGWVPEPNYREERLQLRPGDRVYLNSDGVDEARNAKKELFGNTRVLQALSRSRSLALEDSVHCVLKEAEAFAGHRLEDDVSALALEIERRQLPPVRLPVLPARERRRNGAQRSC